MHRILANINYTLTNIGVAAQSLHDDIHFQVSKHKLSIVAQQAYRERCVLAYVDARNRAVDEFTKGKEPALARALNFLDKESYEFVIPRTPFVAKVNYVGATLLDWVSTGNDAILVKFKLYRKSAEQARYPNALAREASAHLDNAVAIRGEMDKAERERILNRTRTLYSTLKTQEEIEDQEALPHIHSSTYILPTDEADVGALLQSSSISRRLSTIASSGCATPTAPEPLSFPALDGTFRVTKVGTPPFHHDGYVSNSNLTEKVEPHFNKPDLLDGSKPALAQQPADNDPRPWAYPFSWKFGTADFPHSKVSEKAYYIERRGSIS